MSYLIVLIILSAVTYRVSRFIVLDTLIDDTRARCLGWMELRESWMWQKTAELLGCPYCITIWMSAAVCATQHFAVAPIPAPVWTWLAVATGSLVFWAFIDSEE